jgi:hypothetical protein
MHMSLYQLEFRIHETGDCDARAWIDSAAHSFESEIKVHLERNGQRWHGAFFIPDRKPFGFYYRVGVLGRVGTRWSLLIRNVSTSREVAYDADSLSVSKSWIMGSWGLGEEAPALLYKRDAASALVAPTLRAQLRSHERTSRR